MRRNKAMASEGVRASGMARGLLETRTKPVSVTGHVAHLWR